MPMVTVAGIDVGSVSAAAVVLAIEDASVLGTGLVLTGARVVDAANDALSAARDEARSQAAPEVIIATGYGRSRVEGSSGRVTEITCHARGISHLAPEVRTLIDVGGQDCKAIHVGPAGSVLEFAMNDRCAAGTGRFFENMARVLDIDLDDFGHLALRGDGRVDISHVCAVFAESEVVGLLARGVAKADVASALCRSAARLIASVARRVGLVSPVALSGGVARNAGLRAALEQELGQPLVVPESPDIVGALGAALIARDRSRERGHRSVDAVGGTEP